MAGTGKDSGKNGAPTRLLVVGAGVAGQSLVQEIQRDKLSVQPVAFLDDDPQLIGKEICGLPVRGGCDDLLQVADDTGAQEVLLAIPSSGGRLVRRLVILCKRAGLPFRLVPGLRAIIEGDVHFEQVADVQPEHLLGRETVVFHDQAAASVVMGKRVLVTGAGGSIGGELCRQIISLQPSHLILLGRGENSIFEMVAELEPLRGKTKLIPVIADVRDAVRLENLSGCLSGKKEPRLACDIILHAAAHKHVPLMEDNPEEAVLVNVGGTKNLTRFATRVGAERFVLISTDKAVCPSSVMGATKKMAEMVVRTAAAESDSTRFMIVRFGNVLGSRGSVVPFFVKRIAAGLPLPVTDKRMTRYFMTIREAALLVIEAMVMGEQGTTYILEMGNPVSILELAENLLVLSGYDPAGIDTGPGINITGLRPGEKLHESLNEDYEDLLRSDHALIRKTKPANGRDLMDAKDLKTGCDLALAGDVENLRLWLAKTLNQSTLAQGPDLF
ncbi:MAG: polysaccharide biosynthesis protein [bacterium]|nr:polysaccharide biosynthesis protein [bacterium]